MRILCRVGHSSGDEPTPALKAFAAQSTVAAIDWVSAREGTFDRKFGPSLYDVGFVHVGQGRENLH